MASSTIDQQQQLCRRFSLSEMQSATGDFSEAHVIGKGGFGKVYKGLIDNGSVSVAIKRLASNSNQGEREFAAEMETLTRFRHRNLVSLIGYCSEEAEMILVYEYMDNGTLADHLYKLDGSSNDSSSLSWSQRLKICIGAGRGLDYLHSGCSIIHRDVKSTNILLDHNFTAKVSDFGLAKTLSTEMLEKSFVSTNIKGSFGYFDPSYFTTGRLTMASDTYAFGVILLEMLTGKPPTGRNDDELCMTMWAQEKIRIGKAERIVALNLKGEVSEGCLKTFVGVVKSCLHKEPKKRLTMTRAVAQLEFALHQQEKKEITTAPRILQFWPFWNKDIPSDTGSAQKKGENEVEVDELPIYVPAISYAEIMDITHYFSEEHRINNGLGSMFHGILKSGQHVAIKPLYSELDREFITQVSRVSSVKHENVVELVGYCRDRYLRVLVYEFAPRGSLHEILHGRQGVNMEPCPALSWAQRVKIAVGIAEALCYIHDNNLIHDDIVSSNVLLFNDDIAKLTNLGPPTQRSCPCNVPNCDEHPLSRSDYHPLEYKYGLSNQTQKGDVYTFGVVLLELLTGEKVIDWKRGEEQRYLISWAQPQLDSDKVHKIVDARLKGDYPPKAVEMMAAVARLCLQYETECRPEMSLVLRYLKSILPEPQHSPS